MLLIAYYVLPTKPSVKDANLDSSTMLTEPVKHAPYKIAQDANQLLSVLNAH